MISAAEQQFVIKLQDWEELGRRFTKDVIGNNRVTFPDSTFVMPKPDDPIDPRNVLAVIKHLNIEVHAVHIDGVWNIEMGGAQTKKKVKLGSSNLDISLTKSLIIYVRKYL
jgi:hypothetical protein